MTSQYVEVNYFRQLFLFFADHKGKIGDEIHVDSLIERETTNIDSHINTSSALKSSYECVGILIFYPISELVVLIG